MEALKGDIAYPHINESYIGDVNAMKATDLANFTGGIQGKFVYMTQWMQNINFLAGNQWMRYNPNDKMFEIDPNLGNEERITINRVLSAYRMAVGSLLRDRQIPKILQESIDEQDIDSAKVKTRLLEHVRRTGKFLSTQKEALEWSAICGKGINKKFWDPEQEKIIDEVFPAFEFVTPSNVRKSKKMPWVCHARFETTEWVYENYGVDISPGNKAKSKSKLKTTGNSDLGQYGSFLAAVKHIMNDGSFSGTGVTMNWNNVLIKEFWVFPSKKYPDGALIIYVNDELLYADRNPISGKISTTKGSVVKIGQRQDFYTPFNELDFFDLPFRYWPMGLIEPIIGMQQYYNKFFSDTLENFKYAGMPMLWAEKGSVDQDSINREPGSVNEYEHGSQVPHEILPQAVEPAMFQVMSQLAQSIGEIVGIHQMGPGGLPPGVHAAAALAIINEQDQIAKMGVTINLEDFISNDAQQTLYLINKFWPNKTKIRYMGEENRWEVIEFDKEKYAIGDEEITIESKQELATDKMTRFDQVMKMMSTARIDDPTKPLMDVSDGMRILDMQNDMGYITQDSLNWNQAKDENTKLAKAEQVEVLAYENHKIHIQVLMLDMLRVEFKDKPKDVKDAYYQQYQQHQQMMAGVAQSASPQPTQGDQQQPMPGQMPMQPQMQQPMPMGQPQMMQQPQGMPMQGQPMQQPQQATGLAGGMQGGMSNVMQIAAGGQR
jgi:hypothetical protein